jgi:hypothetical protein
VATIFLGQLPPIDAADGPGPGQAAREAGGSLISAAAYDPPFGPNVRVNSETPELQAEVSMAVARDGGLYVGFTDFSGLLAKCAFSGSRDGGRTWSPRESFGPRGNTGDPVVIADRAGNLYRMCLWFDKVPHILNISKSVDGGRTWGPWFNKTAYSLDKEWMAAQDGKLALVYYEYNSTTWYSQIFFSASLDDGKTWTNETAIGPPGSQGSCIEVDAAGALYVFWGLEQVQFRKSTDWGASWSLAKTIGAGSQSHGTPRSASLVACDVDDAGQNVYATWSLQNAKAGDDVVVAHSADGGANWEKPVVVNDNTNTGVRALWPSVALDRSGALHAGWIDNRKGPAQAWYSNSTDGGQTWSTNVRVSDTDQGGWSGWNDFSGDYTTVLVTPQGEPAYAWMDSRNGTLDVWFAKKGPTGGSGLARIEIAPPSATITVDQTQKFSATGYDANGTPMQITSSWSASGGAVDQSGVFTPDKVGTFTVTARSGVVQGKATVTVDPGALASISVDPPAATISADETQRFTAKGADSKGNPVPVSPVWSATGGAVDGSGLYTPERVGSFQVTASDIGKSAAASVTVTSGQVVSLAIEPPAATVRADATLAFTATARDVKGNEVAASVAWSVAGGTGAGSVDGSGIYSPEKVGRFTVAAGTSGLSAEAEVTVVPGALAAVTVSPAEARIDVWEKVAFSAEGHDSKGNRIPGLKLEWTVAAGPGTIDQAGEFTATWPGGATVVAKLSDGEVTKSGAAKVTVAPWRLVALAGVVAAALILFAAAARRGKCAYCGARRHPGRQCEDRGGIAWRAA